MQAAWRPDLWLSRRQRKQGKSITLERVRQLRGALADLCHEWPLGMVRRDHLEQCLPQLHLSEPEYHTYRSIFRQCCTGRSMAARGDRASANMREYCTLLAALVPGTARDRLREFSQNFKGRLTEWKPGLEGTKFGLKTKTALRNMQRQAEPELRVEEINTMFLCLLKLCEDKKNPLPPPSAVGASSLRSSIDGSVGLSVAAESSTDGWTSRRPDIERDEATVVAHVEREWDSERWESDTAQRAHCREVATSSASFVLLRRLMSRLMPRLKDYEATHQPETAPGKFKIQVPSAAAKGKGVRADADVRTESDRDYHAVTQFSHHATSKVPIPFEVLWREVCECGLRPLVAAAAHVQPGSGYVRLALPPDLSRE